MKDLKGLIGLAIRCRDALEAVEGREELREGGKRRFRMTLAIYDVGTDLAFTVSSEARDDAAHVLGLGVKHLREHDIIDGSMRLRPTQGNIDAYRS